jgi:Na+/melibiose symporter-like transporter
MDYQQHKEELPPIKAEPATPEEISWIEHQRKESQGTLKRLEEVAKYLSGLSSVSLAVMLGPSSDIFKELRHTAGLKIGITCWLVSIIFTLIVVFPFRYRYASNSASSIREMYKKITSIKFTLLLFGTLFFLVGIVIVTYIYLFGQPPSPE